MEYQFKAIIDIIGINPFVYVPENILEKIFKQAGKNKGFIPVTGTINNKPYKQTLVKYKGYWRFYVNTTMLQHSPDRIGEEVKITMTFDPIKKTINPHPKLLKALENNIEAKNVFNKLSPSKRNEIIRYISFLKTDESIDRNVKKAVDFLLGKGRFVGRDSP